MKGCAIGLLWVAALHAWAQQPFDLDPSFQTSIQKHNVASIALLPDGDLLLSGRFRLTGEFDDRGLYRVHSDGSGYAGFPYTYGGGKLTSWADRFYVRVGDGVQRIFPEGTVDTGFIVLSTGPYFLVGAGGDYFVYPDGRLVMSGTHHLSDTARGYVGDYNLIWFSDQGYLDTTAHHRACDGHINYIHPLPDGKFLLGGFWSEYDGTPTPNSTHLIRVYPDGALDTTFQCPINWGSPVGHRLLPDGKHLITGLFRVNGSTDTLQIVRLSPDGALDPSFNNHIQLTYPYSSSPTVASIDMLYPIDDHRMVAVGGFTTVDGQPRGGIALLDSAGYLLNDHFDNGGCGPWNDGFDDYAYIVGFVPAPDGGFYIHGSYHGYDDGTTNYPGQRMVSRLYGLDVGIKEQSASQAAVYPNPASDAFRLRDAGTPPLDIVLRDALGRPVRQWSHASPEVSFAVGDLPTGLYSIGLYASTPRFITLLIERP